MVALVDLSEPQRYSTVYDKEADWYYQGKANDPWPVLRFIDSKRVRTVKAGTDPTPIVGWTPDNRAIVITSVGLLILGPWGSREPVQTLGLVPGTIFAVRDVATQMRKRHESHR